MTPAQIEAEAVVLLGRVNALDIETMTRDQINAIWSDLNALRMENMAQGARARGRNPSRFAAHKATIPAMDRVSAELGAALAMLPTA